MSSITVASGAGQAAGRFGEFGGRYVPESLVPACQAVEDAFRARVGGSRASAAASPGAARPYAGRPTPLTPARRLSAELGINLLLKREDLAHTGSHKINNVLGQALLARRMGRTRLIAETGAGQHGVATATAAALLGLPATVFMGERDVERQALNVVRMQVLGAEVVPVRTGSRTLKDATSEAMRHWVGATADSYYCVGSVVGPHPYPWMVREFQRVIGDEARRQCAAELGSGVPDHVVACVGGGSNAAGTFAGFVDTSAAAGRRRGRRRRRREPRPRSACCTAPGRCSCRTSDGQISEAHSVAAGLDYPGVGPEHAHLRDLGRARYETVTDAEAVAAAVRLARAEGIIAGARVGARRRLGDPRGRTGELRPGTTVLLDAVRARRQGHPP